MWSSRQRVGMVYPKNRQRYLNIAPVTNDNLKYSISNDNVLNMANEMSGEGILDLAKEGYQKAKQIGSKVASFYSSQIAKDLINLLPDSDATAAKGFAGEKHAILELANGSLLELMRWDPLANGGKGGMYVVRNGEWRTTKGKD